MLMVQSTFGGIRIVDLHGRRVVFRDDPFTGTQVKFEQSTFGGRRIVDLHGRRVVFRVFTINSNMTLLLVHR